MSEKCGRILLVEDEEALAESIRYSLEREGFGVSRSPRRPPGDRAVPRERSRIS